MKIGVIGLGGIAQKAYLPVYTTLFPEHEWYFSTRTQKTLKELGKKYGVPEERLYTEWRDLTERVDAVFIHTPTGSHDDVCRAFLNKGIPVFVDKPVTENIASTRALLDFAIKQETLLMTGFNRRFAPMVQEIKQLSDKNHIIMQKNQVNKTDFEVRYRIYDLMIHPLDTALYLLDEPATVVKSQVLMEGDHFSRAWVMLETPQATAYVSINNESGTKLEKYEIQSKSETIVLENLTDKVSYTENEITHTKAGDWVTTLEKRGFTPMIKAFIQAVETKGENPVSLESALHSHEICETIINGYEKSELN
ncbi:MAG: Gfo/Idh/MocA family oxidoreductase [Alkalibacterium sp.]|uniref:Gfo/Idh/MocA family protein n=1 Tax=Alkalibacterium sp. TaxID=1872447 RepID=UPI0039705632